MLIVKSKLGKAMREAYASTPSWLLAVGVTLVATAMFGLPLTAAVALAVASYKIAQNKAQKQASEPIDVTPKDESKC